MPAPTTQVDGDAQFAGVNELLPPGTLKDGELAFARNNRCRFGKAEPRLGFLKVPWSNLVTSGASSRPVPYGTVYGRGYFQDSDGVLWAIIAADGKVFKFREGNGSSEIALPPGVIISATVTFTQTVNGLVMFRGRGNDTLIMATLDAGFLVASLVNNTITGVLTENPRDGTEAITQADRGEWINARLFVPTETATEKDLVNISDYFNATRFALVRSQARINQGASDRLLRVMKFGRTDAAPCFKTASIYALYNCNGALSDMRQDEITREFGLLSPRAAINVGKGESDQPDELWFMGTTGSIYKMTPDSGTGLLGVSAVPVSEEMAKTIARVNREVAASTATFELWDDKLYCAVPLDDAAAQSPELIRNVLPSTWPVIPGATYLFTPSDQGTTVTYINTASGGTETLTGTSEFTTVGHLLTFGGVASTSISLKRLYKNVNNAVLVFDFLKGKWAGYDDGAAFTVQEWIKLNVGGEEKLFFIGADGFVNYAEALFDDEVAYEALGNNLHGTGVYDAFGFSSSGVFAVGRRYAYVSGQYESQIVNGSLVIPGGTSYGTFVAVAPTITSYGATGQAIGFQYRLIDWTLEYAGVDHEWLTRAYRCGSLDRKRFPWAHLNVRTFNPSFDLTVKLDGVSEEFDVAMDQTRDNTKYLRPAGQADWDTTNINNDHATPYREDYHVELSDAVSTGSDIVEGVRYYVDSSDCFTACSIDYNGTLYGRGQTFVGVAGVAFWTLIGGTPVVYPPGSYILMGEAGVAMDLHQEAEENFRVSQRGREIQFRGRNDQGRCELVSLIVEGFPVDQRRQKVEA